MAKIRASMAHNKILKSIAQKRMASCFFKKNKNDIGFDKSVLNNVRKEKIKYCDELFDYFKYGYLLYNQNTKSFHHPSFRTTKVTDLHKDTELFFFAITIYETIFCFASEKQKQDIFFIYKAFKKNYRIYRFLSQQNRKKLNYILNS